MPPHVYRHAIAGVAGVAALTALAAPAAADNGACVPKPGRYDFVIEVSGLGRVGSLTGIVKAEGDRTVIDVATEIVVRVAGVVVHRHVETRHTRWGKHGLAAYRATVRSNGKLEKIDVVREGNRLVADRNGTKTNLPGDAVPGFPWAPCIVARPRIFGLRSLRISPITQTGRSSASVRIAGKDVPAQELRFSSPKGWIMWFGPDGTLLRHAFASGSRTVTLTLKRP